MSPILPLFAQAAPAAGGSPWPQLILQFTLIGLIFYFSYGYWKSNVRHGVIEIVPLDESADGQPPA